MNSKPVVYQARKRFGGLYEVSIGAGLGLVSLASHAAIDTTAITTTVTEVAAAIAVVGAAVLIMHLGAKVWKWLKTVF